MQRKSSPQSRGVNAEEKRFIEWCKEQPSIVSGAYGVEVHHCAGSSAKTYVGAQRVHIGHWFCIPLTPYEHNMYHNRKSEFIASYGVQSALWEALISNYTGDIPENITEAIINYGR